MEAWFHLSKIRDEFVRLSTGFGKSFLYSLFPLICDIFRGCRSSIVLVISPFISLINAAKFIVEVRDGDFTDYNVLMLILESFNSREVKDNMKTSR